MSFSKFRTMAHCLILRRFSWNDYWMTRTRQWVQIDLWSWTLGSRQLSELAGTKRRRIKREDRKVWKRCIWCLNSEILILRYLHITSWGKISIRARCNILLCWSLIWGNCSKTVLHLENSDNWKKRKIEKFLFSLELEHLFSRPDIHKFIFTWKFKRKCEFLTFLYIDICKVGTLNVVYFLDTIIEIWLLFIRYTGFSQIWITEVVIVNN